MLRPSCAAGLARLGSVSWLVAVAWTAAPYRAALLAAALFCLIGGGAVLAWHGRAVASCSQDTVCGNKALTLLVIGSLALGVGLAIAGYLYA